jgi:hypothetical protein
MTWHPNTNTIEAMKASRRGEVKTFTTPADFMKSLEEPDIGHYPGWLTAIVWIGLLALGWAPIIAVIYLVWLK